MSAAHTPGPWEPVRLNQFGPHAIRMPFNDTQTFYGVRQIHRDGDARLIAAAPDLLDALEGCHEVMHQATAVLSANDCASVAAMMAKARAAIAKAKGDA